MANRYNQYHEEEKTKQVQKLDDICMELPPYANEYLESLYAACETSTRIAYANDIRSFLQDMQKQNSYFAQYASIKDIPVDLIGRLDFHDIQHYLNSLRTEKYSKTRGTKSTSEVGNARRMRVKASLSGWFRYMYVNRLIPANPVEGVGRIKEKESKAIDRLSVRESQKLMEGVESASSGSGRQKIYEEKTRLRDTAIVKVLLETGIRVSELVGLDLDDIDFDERYFWVIRKGGSSDKVYFNDDVAAALNDYIENERPNYAKEGEKALFLSIQKKRMSVRTIQAMMKKYGTAIIHKTNLSPHKLRKTYGTLLYEQTSDLKMVQDVLGHRTPAVTERYYVDHTNKLSAKKIDLYNNTPDKSDN